MVHATTTLKIAVNMNIKIEHEIRVKVDKELDTLFAEDSKLF